MGPLCAAAPRLASFGFFNTNLRGLSSRGVVEVVGLTVNMGMGILLPTDDGGSGLGTVSALSGFPTPRLTKGTLPLVVGRTRIVSMDVVELVRCLCTRPRGSIAFINTDIMCNEVGLVQRAFSAGGESLACRVGVGHLMCV